MQFDTEDARGETPAAEPTTRAVHQDDGECGCVRLDDGECGCLEDRIARLGQ